MISPPPPRLSIEFVIVGGAIAGITAAVALARAGHKVTVLDNDPDFFKSPMGGGCRVAPNATRLFYRWGMEAALRAASIKSTGVLFARWDNGTLVGTHEWEESVMEELGGDMLLISFAELRRILAECALKHGAVLRPSSPVVSVHPAADRPFVTLASGEVVSADVVVGADGNYLQHITRRTVLEGVGEDDDAKPAGWHIYNAVIPTSTLKNLNDPTISHLPESGKVHTWFSKTYGALGFPVLQAHTGAPIFALFVYVAREPVDCAVRFARKEELLQYLAGGDPRISALVEASTRILSIPMTQQPFLKEWVHRSGNVICIGQSAHPIPPGSIYPLSLAVGDSAALGQVFSHLHRKSQIPAFLHAVQEIREARISAVLAASVGNIIAAALPPGIGVLESDAGRRERAEEDVRNLGVRGPRDSSDKMVSVIEDVFAYDPEDGAESWWQRWGLTQERAERIFPLQTFGVRYVKDE